MILYSSQFHWLESVNTAHVDLQNLATLVGKSTPGVSDYEGTALPQITTQMLDTQLDPGLNSAG